MTSSTARSEHVRSTVAILGVVLAALVIAHLTFDRIARFAEDRLDAYLWKEQDYLRLLSPNYHVGRGAGRLLIYGPSEAREGLLPEDLAAAVSPLRPYQNAQSLGTLDDGVLVLHYLEAAYGPSAIPDALLLGITPRFIAGIRLDQSPLVEGIRKYSTAFTIDDRTRPPSLVPRTRLDSLRARLAWLALEPDRYRRGVVAVAAAAVRPFAPSLAAREQRVARPAKYLTSRQATEAGIRAWLRTPGNMWDAIHRWDPSSDRDRIRAEIQTVRQFAARHRMALYVVNLPELSWNRDLYDPAYYARYISIVREAFGDTPWLDLRTMLGDDEFYDSSHPTWQGGRRVSAAVAEFVAAHRAAGRGGQQP